MVEKTRNAGNTHYYENAKVSVTHNGDDNHFTANRTGFIGLLPLTKSIETHKSPEEIIGDLVRKEIAATT